VRKRAATQGRPFPLALSSILTLTLALYFDGQHVAGRNHERKEIVMEKLMYTITPGVPQKMRAINKDGPPDHTSTLVTFHCGEKEHVGWIFEMLPDTQIKLDQVLARCYDQRIKDGLATEISAGILSYTDGTFGTFINLEPYKKFALVVTETDAEARHVQNNYTA
jgi:hypothetical protein